MSKYFLNLSERQMVSASAFVVTVAGECKSMGLHTQKPFEAFSGVKVKDLGSYTETPRNSKGNHTFSKVYTQMLFKTTPEYISYSTWREVMGNVKMDKVVPTRKQLLDMTVLDFISSRVGSTRKITYTHNFCEYKLAIQQVENSRRG